MRRLAVVGTVLSLGAVGLWVWGGEAEAREITTAPKFDAAAVRCPLPCAADSATTFPLVVTLESGETIDQLLERLGFGATERVELVERLSEHLEIRKVRPGLQVAGYFEGSAPEQLQVEVRRKGRLFLEPSSDGWTSRWHPFVESIQTRQVEGVVEGSLVGALATAGAPIDVAYRMADVLRWDVDFNRDLRTGDRFQVVWEEVYLDGVRDRTGEVVGLAFWNRGRRLEAYRHNGGYYDAEGRPLQKMFLRSPLPFTRVTSRFSHRRFHPVLKTYRPHYGVDYGAPTGTPVRATADGVVSFAAWGKGAGRMVKIRHPNDYVTAYLHLSKFGSGIRPGRRVRQGEVIGYVGSSGLSTAPHLDYRVQLRGKWIDPLSIRSVPADPIPSSAMAEFLQTRDDLRARLVGDGLPWDPVEAKAEVVVATASDSASRVAGR